LDWRRKCHTQERQLDQAHGAGSPHRTRRRAAGSCPFPHFKFLLESINIDNPTRHTAVSRTRTLPRGDHRNPHDGSVTEPQWQQPSATPARPRGGPRTVTVLRCKGRGPLSGATWRPCPHVLVPRPPHQGPSTRAPHRGRVVCAFFSPDSAFASALHMAATVRAHNHTRASAVTVSD
jgi:hypothetical protein